MPQLRIVEGEKKNDHYVLSSLSAVIGRTRGDILIADLQVSSKHARIYFTNDGWMIEDLNSTNGTYINGRIIDQTTYIGVNDVIRIGNTQLVFESAKKSTPPSNTSDNCSGISITQLSDGKPHLIGRDPSADIILNEAVVSRRHAVLQWINCTVVISDCGSRNGTFVNGMRISRYALVQSDKVQIGATEFVFLPQIGLTLSSSKGPIRLDVNHISHCITYRGSERTLLNDVSFSVLPGEFVAIVGGSGTGKTSLFRVLTGLEVPTSGSVALNDIDYHSCHRQFSGQVGFVPQDDIVHGDLTIRTALTYAAKLRLPHDTSETEYEQRVHSVLAAVKLTHRIDSEIKLLSGGERKRVNVALELLTEPNLLFLDEPTSGLDPHREKQMMELMHKLASEGRTVLLTTHSVQSLELCDLLLIMGAGGHVVYYGPPKKALSHFSVSSYEEIYGRIGETTEEALKCQYAYRMSSICQRYGVMRSPGRQMAPNLASIEYSNQLDIAGWFRQLS
ncbi:MAG TPA: FHA domain-containing protein, partial [Armatimonadota bacterium]|nr:FHA domain-containing protein [Armatimonadota bacterium]